jgi:hypothetical protein
MENVQKHNICTNIPSSQAFRYYSLVVQLLSKFSAFYEIWNSITVFTRARHWSLYRARWIPFTLSHVISGTSVSVLWRHCKIIQHLYYFSLLVYRRDAVRFNSLSIWVVTYRQVLKFRRNILHPFSSFILFFFFFGTNCTPNSVITFSWSFLVFWPHFFLSFFVHTPCLTLKFFYFHPSFSCFKEMFFKLFSSLHFQFHFYSLAPCNLLSLPSAYHRRGCDKISQMCLKLQIPIFSPRLKRKDENCLHRFYSHIFIL